VELELTIEYQGRTLPATTKNVSDGGCAVRWTGQLPHVNDEVLLKMENDLCSAGARAIVRWSESRGTIGHTVGLLVIHNQGEETVWYAPFVDGP
jgi:hypothetical protein